MNADRVYLREWRLAKGLTQPELAQRTGTIKSEISRLEKGSRRMTIEWMNKFAKTMGITVEDLLTLPPMGFGAVPPAQSLQETEEFLSTPMGDVTVGVKKDHHQLLTVTGDDWQGTFVPGDVLIYDTTKTGTTVPGLFVIKIDNELIVRRVTPAESGPPMLTCSNTSYPPMTLKGDFNVAGRVVARAHRV